MGIQVRGSRDCSHRQRGKFSSEFFRRFCVVISIVNSFTGICHPQTTNQTERYNGTILAMLRCYDSDQKRDCNYYVPVLAYSYNNGIHSSTKHSSFELLISRNPSDVIFYMSKSYLGLRIGDSKQGMGGKRCLGPEDDSYIGARHSGTQEGKFQVQE